MKIQIVSLNRTIYLPYVYGIFRSFIDDVDPSLADNIEWCKSLIAEMDVKDVLPKLENPDILGLSCYSWNMNRHMKLARLHKEQNPNCLVVVGGPEISNNDPDFFNNHPYIDIAVYGEGEYAFYNIVKEFESGDWTNVKGIAYNKNGRVNTGPGEKISRSQMEELSSPFLKGYFDKYLEIFKSHDIPFITIWETNRGCPYSCTFCDWGAATMGKIRNMSQQRLMDELEWMGKNKIEDIYFGDANFGTLKRDMDITNEIISLKNRTGYPKQMVVNFAKKSNDRVYEISKLMMDNDLLYATTVAMQSLDDDVLKAIKRSNIGNDTYAELNKRYNKNDMRVYTDLILGLPLETKESYKNGIFKLFNLGRHENIRTHACMILPNAQMAADVETYGIKVIKKQALLYNARTPADEKETVEMVTETSTMPKDDWIEAYTFFWFTQILHAGYYTRYVAMYLNDNEHVDYKTFYETMYDDFSGSDTVVGRLLGNIRKMVTTFQKDGRANLFAKTKHFGNVRMFVDYWGWLEINHEINTFYVEFIEWFDEAFVIDDDRMDDLFLYQQSCILRPTYEPNEDYVYTYQYNWLGYFEKDERLEDSSIIRYSDTGTDECFDYSSAKNYGEVAVSFTGKIDLQQRENKHPTDNIQLTLFKRKPSPTYQRFYNNLI